MPKSTHEPAFFGDCVYLSGRHSLDNECGSCVAPRRTVRCRLGGRADWPGPSSAEPTHNRPDGKKLRRSLKGYRRVMYTAILQRYRLLSSSRSRVLS